MIIHAHLLTRNEAHIMPYALRHYATFCERLFVHDMGSTDRTLEIAKEVGATVRNWDTKGEFNDNLNTRIKNECWWGLNPDWAMVLDADEIIYFPKGHAETLSAYDSQKLAVVKPHGFEMLHDTWPNPKGQIYDEAKCGARLDDYSKPVLFAPNRIERIRFSTGAHTLDEIKVTDNASPVNLHEYSGPPCYLLHYHQIGPIEQIATRYDDHTARMCEANIRNKWGCQWSGKIHVQEKRTFIKNHLERVIP
jgi:glycosyltransferase involved in cell wall biosynthesis